MTLNPVTTLMLIWVLFGLSMWIVALLVARHWERRNHLLFLRTALRQSLEHGRANMPMIEPVAVAANIGTSRITWRAKRSETKLDAKSDVWPSRPRTMVALKPLLLTDPTHSTGRTA